MLVFSGFRGLAGLGSSFWASRCGGIRGPCLQGLGRPGLGSSGFTVGFFQFKHRFREVGIRNDGDEAGEEDEQGNSHVTHEEDDDDEYDEEDEEEGD